jgi:hypothetical protein
MNSGFPEAIVTDPVEIQSMRQNRARNCVAHPIVEVILRRNCEVPHNATLFTHKMVVLFDGRVVSVKTFTEIEFANFPLRCKDMEVAVDGAKRHPRNLLTHLCVYPFRSRMRSRPVQNLINLLTLSASLCPEDLHG